MPILESNADQSAYRRVLITTGLGLLFGLFFGLPPALGARAMGGPWLPYGLGVILCGLFVGFLLASLVVRFLVAGPRPRASAASSQGSPSHKPFHLPHNGNPVDHPLSPIGQRLAGANFLLENLDSERARLHDSRVGSAAEQNIVWRELLELELQDIDEQVGRIRFR
jgi:hypothetical protein